MSGTPCHLLLFSQCQLRQIWPHRPEPKLAIKPERARFDSLFVLVSNLVRIDRKDCDTEQLLHQTQDSRVQPRGLAFAKCVVKIEPALHALKNREPFEISNRHAVLKNNRGVISAQRQTMFRRPAEHERLRTAPEFR